jgi:hypothetical protein
VTILEFCAASTLALVIFMLFFQSGRWAARRDRGAQNGKQNENLSLGDLGRRVEVAEKSFAARFDQANRLCSKLVTDVETLEKRMRDVFVDSKVCEAQHKALHAEIQLLRTHGRDGVES